MATNIQSDLQHLAGDRESLQDQNYWL